MLRCCGRSGRSAAQPGTWGSAPVAWTPQLNIICGRCGKPRGLRHVCVSNRATRKATVKAAVVVRAVPEVPASRSRQPADPRLPPEVRLQAPPHRHGKRKADQAKARGQGEARRRRPGPKHDYQACTDGDCQRPLCVAFKTGYKTGHHDGYEQGSAPATTRGFPAGMAACPRAHK